MKYIKIITLSLFIISCNNSQRTNRIKSPEDIKFNELTSIVDRYAEKILQRGNVNSFALALYKDGKIYQNYYGEIDKGANNKPTDSSLYEIASITKTFTGSLVAKAVLDGKINLDDDVRKYLDGDYSNLEYESHPITIKHLLTHSLGFKNKTPKGLKATREKISKGVYDNRKDFYSIEDFLEELKTIKLNKKPGTVYAYNSVGPELLAYILEKVNNISFEKQLEIFFKEIGMNNTYIQGFGQNKKNLVNGYKDEGKAALQDFCPLYGAAGGAVATLTDLTIYMQFLLENKDKSWVKEASRSLFIDKENDENIGYLWQNIGYAKEEGYYYSKTGTSSGTQSGVLICPDSNYGIVLIVNNTSEDSYRDWATLFFRDIEPDLIKYPKLNLFSTMETKFINDTEKAFTEYRKLKKDTSNYFFKTIDLNSFGYELLNKNQEQKAIAVFKLIIEEFPENANAYDSLGEAYFLTKDYDNALLNYKKSLELNPNNDGAKKYIKKIEQLSL